MKTVRLILLLVLVLAHPFLAFADDIPFRVQRREIFRVMPITSEDIVFLGNSITNFGMWDEFFGSTGKVVNRGISGNISGEVLEHIDLIVAGKPKKLFLMIGINDYQDESVIIPNTRRIIEVFQKESPATEIYIQSLLPCDRADRHSMVEPVNKDLKELCKEMNVTYIDVYSKIVKAGTPPGIADKYTNDNLHVVAAGYREWINDYEQYVGYAPCLADGNNVFASGLVAFENIMISQFNMLPVNDGDILMVGDYNVQTGEWAELMQSGKVKNRGIGIGYGYSFTASKLNSAVQHIVKGKPAKIFVQCGARDMAGAANVGNTFTQYSSAIKKMRNIAPDADIYLQTLIPVTDGNINKNYFVPFNNKIKELAANDTSGKIHVVDVYEALTENGVLNPKFVGANTAQSRGINGRAYLRWANTLAPFMGDDITALPELTDEQYELNETVSAARRIVYTAQADNTPGSYSADAIVTLRSAMEVAANVLAKKDATSEEITEQTELLQNTMEAIASQAVLPQFSTSDSTYYYTLSTPRRSNLYLTNEEGILWGRNKSFSDRQQWKFVQRPDNAVNIVNRVDGSFLTPIANANAQLKTVADEPEKGWYLIPTGNQKLFIVVNESVQLHQANASQNNKIINWGSGTNNTDDGCLFLINNAPRDEERPVEPWDGKTLIFTNIQQNGTENVLYIDDAGTLNFSATQTAEELGEKAKFIAEMRSENKYSLYNEASNCYMIWRGNTSGGYNGNKGTLDTYNSTYCDWQFIDAGNTKADTYYLLSKRSNGSEGSIVLMSSGRFDAYSNAVGWSANFSNLFYISIIEQDETGIEYIENSETKTKAIYDLSGRRINDITAPGIYILNGKKVLIK